MQSPRCLREVPTCSQCSSFVRYAVRLPRVDQDQAPGMLLRDTLRDMFKRHLEILRFRLTVCQAHHTSHLQLPLWHQLIPCNSVLAVAPQDRLQQAAETTQPLRSGSSSRRGSSPSAASLCCVVALAGGCCLLCLLQDGCPYQVPGQENNTPDKKS